VKTTTKLFYELTIVVLGGALFGLGLASSTMVSPEVVLGFLRGQDTGILLVMSGAIFVTLISYQFLPKLLAKPILSDRFVLRVANLDKSTIIGAAIFGIGWGLCGVCPGPAIASIGSGNFDLLWALVGIFIGSYIQGIHYEITHSNQFGILDS